MQASEFVFKVPKVRKRWRSLYCREKISDLNQVWEESGAMCQSASSVTDGRSRSSARNLFGVKSTELVELDISCDRGAVHSFTPIETINEDGKKNLKEVPETVTESKDVLLQTSHENKYTVGLFEELRTSAGYSGRVTEMSENFCQDVPVNSESSFLQHPDNRREPNRDSDDGEIFGQGAEASTDRSDSAPGSPDILIVKDESISTDSDDDWESTTPPAPSSPSDHTVPDLTDLKTIGTPSEYLLFSSPFSLPQAEEWSMSQVPDIMQTSGYQHISSLDSVFTNFYY